MTIPNSPSTNASYELRMVAFDLKKYTYHHSSEHHTLVAHYGRQRKNNYENPCTDFRIMDNSRRQTLHVKKLRRKTSPMTRAIVQRKGNGVRLNKQCGNALLCISTSRKLWLTFGAYVKEDLHLDELTRCHFPLVECMLVDHDLPEGSYGNYTSVKNKGKQTTDQTRFPSSAGAP